MNLTYDVNNKIRVKEVRVIDAEGAQIGVLATTAAQVMADDAGLDLVLINPTTQPPLAKIVDFGKFKYELAQREKEQKKKSRETQVELKEIQLRPVTDSHDIMIKAKRASGFLKDGDKVKVVVKFKGREMSHREMGQKILDAFCTDVDTLSVDASYKIDSPAAMNGRQMMMILAPVKK